MRHQVSAHCQDGGFFRRETKIGEHIAAGASDFFFHASVSYQLVTARGKVDVFLAGFLRFFAEGVLDVHSVLELCHIDHAPLTQDMHPDFKSPRADGRHGFEVGRTLP